MNVGELRKICVMASMLFSEIDGDIESGLFFEGFLRFTEEER